MEPKDSAIMMFTVNMFKLNMQEPSHERMSLMATLNKKGADQLVHLHSSLLSTFAALLRMYNISSFYHSFPKRMFKQVFSCALMK